MGGGVGIPIQRTLVCLDLLGPKPRNCSSCSGMEPQTKGHGCSQYTNTGPHGSLLCVFWCLLGPPCKHTHPRGTSLYLRARVSVRLSGLQGGWLKWLGTNPCLLFNPPVYTDSWAACDKWPHRATVQRFPCIASLLCCAAPLGPHKNR